MLSGHHVGCPRLPSRKGLLQRMYNLMHWHVGWGFPKELPWVGVRWYRFTRHQNGWSIPHTLKHLIERKSWSHQIHSGVEGHTAGYKIDGSWFFAPQNWAKMATKQQQPMSCEEYLRLKKDKVKSFSKKKDLTCISSLHLPKFVEIVDPRATMKLYMGPGPLSMASCKWVSLAGYFTTAEGWWWAS